MAMKPRSLILATVGSAVLFLACGSSTPVQPRTPTPSVPALGPTNLRQPTSAARPLPGRPISTPPRAPSRSDAAVYLSLGDSIQYGCCLPQDPQASAHPIFARYLEDKLNRPVDWVTLAGNDTTTEFVEGVGGVTPSQLDRALAAIEEYRREGRAIVAITLSIGGNDLLGLRAICRGRGGSSPECVSAFAGHACEYIRDVDPTEEGYRVIAQLYQDAYDKLPAEFVEPWVARTPNP